MVFAHSSLITLLHAPASMVTLVSTVMYHQLMLSRQLLPPRHWHQSHVQLESTFAKTAELALSIQPWMPCSATAFQASLAQLAPPSSHSVQVVLARTVVLVWPPTLQLLAMASAHVPLDSQAPLAILAHAMQPPTATIMASVSPTMVWSRVCASRVLEQIVPPLVRSMERESSWSKEQRKEILYNRFSAPFFL